MYRLILLAFAVHASYASAVTGNDYILRIDMIEHAVAPVSESEPYEAPVCSIEVFARPAFPFHGRVSVGAATVSASGELRAADNGKFVAQFQFEHSIDTGKTILGDDGAQKPVIDKSVARTSVSVPIGASVDIGGLLVKDAKTRQTRQIRYVVTLSRYAPLKN